MSVEQSTANGIFAPLTRQDVLRYYRENIVNSLAIAQFTANEFPAGILNDIRDAMTHLSRTLDTTLSEEDIEKELIRAKNHFERVRLDCAKLTYVSIAENYSLSVDLLTKNGIDVPQGLQLKSEEIKKKRLALNIEEGLAAPFKDKDNIANKLKSITDEFDRLFYQYKPDFGGNVLLSEKFSALSLKKKMLDDEYYELRNPQGLHTLADRYFEISKDAEALMASFNQEYNTVLLKRIANTRRETNRFYIGLLSSIAMSAFSLYIGGTFAQYWWAVLLTCLLFLFIGGFIVSDKNSFLINNYRTFKADIKKIKKCLYKAILMLFNKALKVKGRDYRLTIFGFIAGVALPYILTWLFNKLF